MGSAGLCFLVTATRPQGTAWSCVREGQGKILHQRLEQVPQGSAHGPKLLDLKKTLDNALRQRVWILGVPGRSQETDSITLVGPFRFRMFYGSCDLESIKFLDNRSTTLCHRWKSTQNKASELSPPQIFNMDNLSAQPYSSRETSDYELQNWSFWHFEWHKSLNFSNRSSKWWQTWQQLSFRNDQHAPQPLQLSPCP